VQKVQDIARLSYKVSQMHRELLICSSAISVSLAEQEMACGYQLPLSASNKATKFV
jgi:hypothetical protein